ncbi:hypothetical protein FHG87_021015 [Trinorchestia longiramus]|nr:hypothetical protein FHG87_021015 [Trinorchestia longiramus]
MLVVDMVLCCQMLVMVGTMAVVVAVVCSLEYAFCYDAEKQKFKETLEQMALARRTFRRRTSWQQLHHLGSTSSSDGAHSAGLPLLVPPSPSLSCDADRSASADECQSDDDDDGE